MFYPADKRVIKPIVTAFLESIGQEELISTYGWKVLKRSVSTPERLSATRFQGW